MNILIRFCLIVSGLSALSSCAMEQSDKDLLVSFEDKDSKKTEEVTIPAHVLPLFKTLNDMIEDASSGDKEGVPLGIATTKVAINALIELANAIVSQKLDLSHIINKIEAFLSKPIDEKLLRKYLEELALVYYLDAPLIVEAYCYGIAGFIKNQKSLKDRAALVQFIMQNIGNPDITFAIADKFETAHVIEIMRAEKKQYNLHLWGKVALRTSTDWGALSPRGSFFVIGNIQRKMNTISKKETGKEEVWKMMGTLRWPRNFKNLGGFSADEKSLILAADDTFTIWNQNEAGKWNESELLHDEETIQALAFNPAENIFASGGKNPTIRLWESNSRGEWNLEKMLEEEPEIATLAFNYDGKWLAVAHANGSISFWHQNDLKEWDLIKKVYDMEPVKVLAFSKDSNTLASVGSGSTIRLWSFNKEKKWELETILSEDHAVAKIAFGLHRWLATANDHDKRIRMWKRNIAGIWELIGSIESLIHPISSLLFDPSDNSLIVAGKEGISIFPLAPLSEKLWKYGAVDLSVAVALWSYCQAEDKKSFDWSIFSGVTEYLKTNHAELYEALGLQTFVGK